MAFWNHKTKTGRICYDRPKNTFRVSDVKRITARLEKPWVVLPQGSWKALFRADPALLVGVQGWFHDFLRESVHSNYTMEGTVAAPMGDISAWDSNWRQSLCELILSKQQVTLLRSDWIG